MALREAWKEALVRGWSSGEASSMRVLRLEARLAGWQEVETRPGKGTETVLRPSSQHAAPYPRSISAIHGLDEQPLHVDGAHFPVPPDAVLLFCEAANDTPTNVMAVRNRYRDSPGIDECLRHGLFVVGSGPASFLAPALEEGRFRYDPNIMTPGDARARQAADYFRSLQEQATPVPWTVPKTYLLIANRHAFHGRAKVSEGDVSREVKRVAFRVGVGR